VPPRRFNKEHYICTIGSKTVDVKVFNKDPDNPVHARSCVVNPDYEPATDGVDDREKSCEEVTPTGPFKAKRQMECIAHATKHMGHNCAYCATTSASEGMLSRAKSAWNGQGDTFQCVDPKTYLKGLKQGKESTCGVCVVENKDLVETAVLSHEKDDKGVFSKKMTSTRYA
jgi:hypothetical protein